MRHTYLILIIFVVSCNTKHEHSGCFDPKILNDKTLKEDFHLSLHNGHLFSRIEIDTTFEYLFMDGDDLKRPFSQSWNINLKNRNDKEILRYLEYHSLIHTASNERLDSIEWGKTYVLNDLKNNYFICYFYDNGREKKLRIVYRYKQEDFPNWWKEKQSTQTEWQW